MNDYFSQPIKVQKEIIEVAALKMGVDPIIVEKDLWITITLQALFSKDMPDVFVLKGDTSLSKAFGVIERFSDEINITIDKSIFGTPESLNELSGACRLEDVYQKAQGHTRSQIKPLLLQKLKELTKQDISLNISPDRPLSLEILYTSLFQETYNHIKSKINIEFDVSDDLEPYNTQTVTSFVHTQIKALKALHVKVKGLSPVRSLIEKAILLHGEAYRPISKPIPIRLSRHYYDLHQLYSKGYFNEPTKHVYQLEDIIKHKRMMLRSVGAKDILNHGIKLLPPDERIKDLKKDYRKMSEMFFGHSPSVEKVLSTLEELERDINISIAKSA